MLMSTTLWIMTFLLLVPAASNALVSLDDGQRQIKGVQLLQDFNDPTTYYYVPQFPRLATKDDGTFEILCIKFVDSKEGAASGGLFHALVEFTLPAEVLEEVEKELKKQVPNSRIAGAVPLMQSAEKGEIGRASCRERV